MTGGGLQESCLSGLGFSELVAWRYGILSIAAHGCRCEDSSFVLVNVMFVLLAAGGLTVTLLDLAGWRRGVDGRLWVSGLSGGVIHRLSWSAVNTRRDRAGFAENAKPFASLNANS